MKIQRLSTLMVGTLAAILATACSSSSGSGSGSTSTAPTQVGVREEYEAQGDLPASGGITEITFYDDKIYSLKQTTGCDTGEALCHEHGTYALDTKGGTLTLTPSSGSPRTMPFTAGAKSGATTTAPSSVQGLHTLGGVSLGGSGSGGVSLGSDGGTSLEGDAGQQSLICITIDLLASFTIGGQTFTADLQVSVTTGGEAGTSIMGGGCGSDAGAGGEGDGGGGGSDGGGSGGDAGGGTGGDGGGTITNPLMDAGLTSGDATTIIGGDAGGGSDAGSSSGSDSGTDAVANDAAKTDGSATDAAKDSGGVTDSGAKDSGSKGSGSGSGSGSGAGSSSGSGTGSSSSSSISAPATGANALGVDISHYQGSINWSKVHTSKDYAYAKATEGTSYTDLSFGTNWQAMKAAGVTRGAYHFYRASQDPVKQADFFVQTIANKGGFNAGSDLAPMVDVEVTDGASAATLVSGLKKFIAEAESKLGGNVKLVIYTGPSFWINTLGNPNLSTNPLWIAHYTTAAKPWIPSHWSTYTIWQYTDVVSTPGISAGGVDGDRWNGPESTVQAFLRNDE